MAGRPDSNGESIGFFDLPIVQINLVSINPKLSQMKRSQNIFIFIPIFITSLAFGQLTDYSNFSLLENGEIIWKKVYERTGMSTDSIKHLIYNNVTAHSSMQIIEESDEELIVELNEMVFEKKGDLFNGVLNFSVKEGRYRVVLSGIRRHLGVKRKNLAGLTGSTNEANLSNNSGYRLEDTFVTNKGNSLTGKSGLDYYNGMFEKGFDFKIVNQKKEEW